MKHTIYTTLAIIFQLSITTYCWWFRNPANYTTLQGINISHLGKRKIIFKSDFSWDMLVPWRVYMAHIYIYIIKLTNDPYDHFHHFTYQQNTPEVRTPGTQTLEAATVSQASPWLTQQNLAAKIGRTLPRDLFMGERKILQKIPAKLWQSKNVWGIFEVSSNPKPYISCIDLLKYPKKNNPPHLKWVPEGFCSEFFFWGYQYCMYICLSRKKNLSDSKTNKDPFGCFRK